MDKLTKYERARIIGARALQIAMGAPLLVKLKKSELEKIKYSPITIAHMEYDREVLPLTIKRPLPEKTEEGKGEQESPEAA